MTSIHVSIERWIDGGGGCSYANSLHFVSVRKNGLFLLIGYIIIYIQLFYFCDTAKPRTKTKLKRAPDFISVFCVLFWIFQWRRPSLSCEDGSEDVFHRLTADVVRWFDSWSKVDYDCRMVTRGPAGNIGWVI